MGLSKTGEFTKSRNELVAIAKSLRHPALIAILQFPATQKSCIGGTLQDELPLSQFTVSQHLKVLKMLQAKIIVEFF